MTLRTPLDSRGTPPMNLAAGPDRSLPTPGYIPATSGLWDSWPINSFTCPEVVPLGTTLPIL